MSQAARTEWKWLCPMQVTDPVCRATLALYKAGGQEGYRGWAYFFCATRCQKAFAANPERYVGKEQGAVPPPASEVLEE